MKLWLLRHGEAEPYHVRPDPERSLTPKGVLEVQNSAHQLLGVAIERVLVSPYVRAQQSAQCLCASLEYKGPLETVDWILPDSDPQEAVVHLDQYTDSALLLVTHQNFVGALAGWLIEGSLGSSVPFSTGAFACLEGPSIAAGLMTLTQRYHPVLR